jgi:SOS-response transcriptional repressor LexA
MKQTSEIVFHDLQQIFRWIIQYKTEHDGNSPSLAEMMGACCISSKSVALYELHRLQKAGLIRLMGRKQARRIHIVGGEWHFNGNPI